MATPNVQTEQSIDALIVGAGFSGLHLLYKLRNAGLNVKVHEASESMGGIWYWNCYPGARVDSDCQIYQFPNKLHPDIWRNWEWKQLYPGRDELIEYFKYVDQTLDLSKNIYFNSRVISAQFDEARNQWLVKTSAGQEIWTTFLFLSTGFVSKRYTPNFKGLDKFKGECHHTGAWSQNGLDLAGKNVAVIGTGASGVQVIQELGPIVNHLTVYQRTPNIALPMRQSSDPQVVRLSDSAQLERFDLLPKTFGGFPLAFDERNALDVTPAERQEFYEMRYSMAAN